jgi:sugar lactone lactonase YvrE
VELLRDGPLEPEQSLGGSRLDELYITTSRERVDLATHPLAGALFRAGMSIAEMPVREFAG